MMLLRLSTLASGRTGVRRETAQAYADLLSAGSDAGGLRVRKPRLLRRSRAAGARRARGHGRGPGSRPRTANCCATADALRAHGLTPVTFAEKEGLALINGTDGMLGQLVLALTDLDDLFRLADVAAAMSVEGQLGTDRVFADDLQQLRPHPGQAVAAANMTRAARRLRRSSPATRCRTARVVQDAYSLRCAPQVAGAARDTAAHARVVAERELASVIDNPVVTLDGRVESNGNFHGAPVAYVLDFLAIVVADLASISERRTDRFLDVGPQPWAQRRSWPTIPASTAAT